MSDKPEWVAQLEGEPCACVRCTACNGSGTIYFDLRGRYVGKSRMDDLDDMEPCDMCKGGIAEECDRCLALEDYDLEAA